MVLRELFSAIASAVRERGGTSASIKATDLPARIRALPYESGISLRTLKIVTAPAKTAYSASCFTGEAFAPAGMTFQATVGDGSRSFTFPVALSLVTFEPAGRLTVGTKSVTAVFRFGNGSARAAQAVTVKQRAATWAELESACKSWARLEAAVSAWKAMEAL